MQEELNNDSTETGRETVVVFGGAGFIGTHLLEYLLLTTDFNLVSVDIHNAQRPVTKVKYIMHDVRDLTDLCIHGNIAKIYNLAAVHTTPGHEPWEYYDTNVRGAIEVTQFAQRYRVNRLTFTSSISVYGPDERPKDEMSEPAPISDYGRSKYLAETIHHHWQKLSPNNKLVIARPAVVFGLGEGGNFTRLARLLKKGFFLYPGRKDTIKSCIYVKDLISWMLNAENYDKSVLTFNGAYSNRYTIEDIVETFRRVAFSNARSALVPSSVLKLAAKFLRPLSAAGLGIHPDRIEKLMVSTNILPSWAESMGLDTKNRLEHALQDWLEQGSGEFK